MSLRQIWDSHVHLTYFSFPLLFFIYYYLINGLIFVFDFFFFKTLGFLSDPIRDPIRDPILVLSTPGLPGFRDLVNDQKSQPRADLLRQNPRPCPDSPPPPFSSGLTLIGVSFVLTTF